MSNFGMWVTPDLARNPSLAFDVANQKDPHSAADLVSHTAKTVATSDAITEHANTNGTHGFWQTLGHGAVTGLEWLGKPLKEVQRDYKFVHSVYANDGFLPGFVATIGIVAGGVGGAVLGGGVGAVLGADLAAGLTRKVMGNLYQNSYANSENENYKVSPGRDFSNALATATDAIGMDAAAKALRNTKSGFGKTVSGIGDIGFDLTTDPTMLVGRFGQLMRGGKYLKLEAAAELQLRYPIMKAVPGIKEFLASHTGVALTSDQMDAVYKGKGLFNAVARNYRAALQDIASSTAGEIAVKYPALGTVAAGRLGKIDTAEGVHQFLKEGLFFGEAEGNLAGQAILPSRTLLKATLGSRTVADAIAEKTAKGLAKIPGVSPELAKAVANGTGNVAALPAEAIKYLRNADNKFGGIYKTFSGYMPYSIDPKTLQLSLTKFRWDAPDAATTVYRIARFGMGDSAAKEWAGKYAEAVAEGNIGLARSLKNQSIFHTLLAAGLPDDHAFVVKAWEEVNKLGEPLVSTQIYGKDVMGNTLGGYVANGISKTAGLFEHQAQTMFDIPDFMEIKSAMREAGQFSKVFGKIDDFASSHYTNRIFKPLALATAGFGLRVSAAELIPTFARYGVINTFKAKLATTVAKQRLNLAPKEANSILSAALVGLGAHAGLGADVMQAGFPAFQEAKRRGLEFAAKMLPDEQLDLATKLVIANNGHFLSDAVSTGHGYDASTSYQMGQAAHYYYQIQKDSPLFRDLPEYTTYSSSDIHYAPRLATDLGKASKDVAQKNIAADALEASKMLSKQVGAGKVIPSKVFTEEFHSTTEYQDFRKALIDREYSRMLQASKGDYKPYEKQARALSRWQDAISSGDLRSFAADRVDATLGMLMGKDGTFHSGFAENIVAGRSTDLNDIAAMAKNAQESLPRSVAGPVLQPYTSGDTAIEKIVNIGFKKVIDPIVNGLAREPLYMLHVGDAYARLAPRIGKGLTEDQALRIAQTQASLGMLPQIHNTALRSQFAQIARNFLPFYFAQEQALKRAFNTLKDTSIVNPAFSRGFRFYQLAEQSLSDPGFVETDENGNRYVYLPGVGAFGEAVQAGLKAYGFNLEAGLPITAKGSLISLKSVLPELQMPGVSPIVAIAGNLVTDFFPATKSVVDKGIGAISADRGVLDTLVPAAWAKTALSALSPIDLNRQMSNAIASALATAYYHGQVPGPDSTAMDRQIYVDRIKNNARSILLMKTFLNLVSPLAPSVSQEDSGFRDEFWKLVKSKGNYADALQTFLGEHGDTAISYTVAKTYANVPGAKVPYIQSTLDFIGTNKKLFESGNGTSAGAFFLVPQDSTGSNSERNVYNELMAMHFRSQRTPEELLKQFYIAQGDQAMSGQIQEHLAIMKNSITPFQREQERTRWSGIVGQMKNTFPIWYEDYTTGGSATNAQNAYNQIVKILSGPQRPQGEQVDLVGQLVNQYQNYQVQVNQYKAINLQGAAVQQVKQNWSDYLMQLALDEPRLATVINSVFMKLG